MIFGKRAEGHGVGKQEWASRINDQTLIDVGTRKAGIAVTQRDLVAVF